MAPAFEEYRWRTSGWKLWTIERSARRVLQSARGRTSAVTSHGNTSTPSRARESASGEGVVTARPTVCPSDAAPPAMMRMCVCAPPISPFAIA